MYEPLLEISIDSLLENLRAAAGISGGVSRLMPVVKDSAYGLGASALTPELVNEGVRFLVVGSMDEAYKLKAEGIDAKILALCRPDIDALSGASGISYAVNSIESLKELADSGLSLELHINIDTGMGRLGILPEELERAAEIIKSAPGIHIEAFYTHFACADDPDNKMTDSQAEEFYRALDSASRLGITWDFLHLPNSAGLLNRSYGKDVLFRPGIIIYGCRPDPEVDPSKALNSVDLKQVVRLSAPVVRIKRVPAGTPVSYGATYRTEKETCIATLATGYAHGVPRMLSNRGDVLIKGRRYRIVGNVTMDYIMVDIGSSSGIKTGDYGVIIGEESGECITPDEVALKAGTIGYEILCNLNTRIKRLYTKDGCTVRRHPKQIY